MYLPAVVAEAGIVFNVSVWCLCICVYVNKPTGGSRDMSWVVASDLAGFVCVPLSRKNLVSAIALQPFRRSVAAGVYPIVDGFISAS